MYSTYVMPAEHVCQLKSLMMYVRKGYVNKNQSLNHGRLTERELQKQNLIMLIQTPYWGKGPSQVKEYIQSALWQEFYLERCTKLSETNNINF